jgi:hypothetical protein
MMQGASMMGKWASAASSTLARRAGRALSGLASRDVAWFATAGLLCLGIVLRMRGMWVGRIMSLWGDEAGWAMRLIDWPLKQHALRAIGFVAVEKLLVSVFSASEQVLRFLPWCAGAGALLLAPLLAARLFRWSGARLFFVAVVALHPGAIDLSKEFKPYAVALFLHMLLLLFVLRYADERRERDLMASIGTAFFGFVFSQDVILTYPAVFGLLGLLAWRAKQREHLIEVLFGAGFTIALLLAVRHNVASKLGDMNQGAIYWGNKYNVFYVEQADSTRFSWMMDRMGDLASMPGKRRELWHWASLTPETLDGIKRVEAWGWVLLCSVGAIALAWRRQFLQLVLLGLPIVTLVAFNYFGYWPLGDFRTNLFALAYFAAFAAAAFDVRVAGRATSSTLLPMLLVALPFLTVGRSNHSRKTCYTVDAYFMQAAWSLIDLQGKGRGDVLALDGPSCGPWLYYERYHPGSQREALKHRFQAECGKKFSDLTRLVRAGLKAPNSRAFILASGDAQVVALQTKLPKDLVIVGQKLLGDGDTLVLSVAKRARRGR